MNRVLDGGDAVDTVINNVIEGKGLAEVVRDLGEKTAGVGKVRSLPVGVETDESLPSVPKVWGEGLCLCLHRTDAAGMAFFVKACL